MFLIEFLKKFEVHSTLIIAFLLFLHHIAEPEEMTNTNVSLDFEVYGRVQGVFFRKRYNKRKKLSVASASTSTLVGRGKEDLRINEEEERHADATNSFFLCLFSRHFHLREYTHSKAKELGLTGWCMNTKEGTVLGYVEGEKNKVAEMKHWLKTTGSPQSMIDKAEFRNEKEIDSLTLEDFVIKKKIT